MNPIKVEQKKKTLILLLHYKQLTAWATCHKEWNIDDRKQVIWSDETKINRLGHDRCEIKWINRQETRLEAHKYNGTK